MRSILPAIAVAFALAISPAPAIAAEPALLSGIVFDDLNGNGVQDPGEPGHALVTVTLDIGADGSVDMSTTTAGNGAFSFLGITGTTYRVRIVVPSGSIQNSPSPADITPNADVAGVNFALAPAPPVVAVPATSPLALAGIALLLAAVGFRLFRSS